MASSVDVWFSKGATKGSASSIQRTHKGTAHANRLCHCIATRMQSMLHHPHRSVASYVHKGGWEHPQVFGIRPSGPIIRHEELDPPLLIVAAAGFFLALCRSNCSSHSSEELNRCKGLCVRERSLQQRRRRRTRRRRMKPTTPKKKNDTIQYKL